MEWWNFQGLIYALISGSDLILKDQGKGQGQGRAKAQIHLIGWNFTSISHKDFKLGSYFSLWKDAPSRAKGKIHLTGYNFRSNCYRDFKVGSYFSLW